jgi:hypothetical protein
VEVHFPEIAVDLHGAELLLPPQPAIDIPNTNITIASAYPIFMTSGLPEHKSCEQRQSPSRTIGRAPSDMRYFNQIRGG